MRVSLSASPLPGARATPVHLKFGDVVRNVDVRNYDEMFIAYDRINDVGWFVVVGRLAGSLGIGTMQVRSRPELLGAGYDPR